MRTVKTTSGATAVQVVWSSRGGSREIEHFGSAHDEAEPAEPAELAEAGEAAGQEGVRGQAGTDRVVGPAGSSLAEAVLIAAQETGPLLIRPGPVRPVRPHRSSTTAWRTTFDQAHKLSGWAWLRRDSDKNNGPRARLIPDRCRSVQCAGSRSLVCSEHSSSRRNAAS